MDKFFRFFPLICLAAAVCCYVVGLICLADYQMETQSHGMFIAGSLALFAGAYSYQKAKKQNS